MRYIAEDTYLCPTCGCMFERNELGDNAPPFEHAIEKRDEIHCLACGELGMDYMARGLRVLFRTTVR